MCRGLGLLSLVSYVGLSGCGGHVDRRVDVAADAAEHDAGPTAAPPNAQPEWPTDGTVVFERIGQPSRPSARACPEGAVVDGDACARWLPGGALSCTRHTASLLPDGRVLVLGACQLFCFQTPAAVFDPSIDLVDGAAAPLFPRSGHGSLVLPDGSVLVAGGRDVDDRLVAAVERFDPTLGTWQVVALLRVSREAPELTLLADGAVLVSGGDVRVDMLGPRTCTDAVERIDVRSGTSHDEPPLRAPRCADDSTTVELEDGSRLHVDGDRAMVLGANAATAEDVGSPRHARVGAAGARLADGRVLLVGGTPYASVDEAEIFDARTRTFAPTARHTGSHLHATATALRDGRVLVIGDGAEIWTRSAR